MAFIPKYRTSKVIVNWVKGERQRERDRFQDILYKEKHFPFTVFYLDRFPVTGDTGGPDMSHMSQSTVF